MTLSCLKFLSRLIRRLKMYSKLVLENKKVNRSAIKIANLNFKIKSKKPLWQQKIF